MQIHHDFLNLQVYSSIGLAFVIVIPSEAEESAILCVIKAQSADFSTAIEVAGGKVCFIVPNL